MARLRRPSLHEDEEEEEEEEEAPSQANGSIHRAAGRASQNFSSLSPSPVASFSSDKENHRIRRNTHGKPKAIPASKLPTPGSAEPTPAHSSKRRRLGERDASQSSAAESQHEISGVEDTRYYDPDQPMEERRYIRRGYRDLVRELVGECTHIDS